MSTSRLLGCAVALLCTASTAAWAQDNSDPAANIIPNMLYVTAGDFVTLNGSGSFDPDGDSITFSWAQLLGDPVTLSFATPSMPTFTAPATSQEMVFQLSVTDIYDATSAPAFAHVFVSAVPEPDAVWMFGTGILTLLGVARLRKQFA